MWAINHFTERLFELTGLKGGILGIHAQLSLSLCPTFLSPNPFAGQQLASCKDCFSLFSFAFTVSMTLCLVSHFSRPSANTVQLVVLICVDKSGMCSCHGESLPTIPRIGWQVAVVFPCSCSTLAITLAITHSFDKLRLMGVMNKRTLELGWKDSRFFLKAWTQKSKQTTSAWT